MTGGEAIGRRDALAQTLLPCILVLLIPFGLACAPGIFNDGDISWHVAAGRWMLAHGTNSHDRPLLLHGGRAAVGGDGMARRPRLRLGRPASRAMPGWRRCSRRR